MHTNIYSSVNVGPEAACGEGRGWGEAPTPPLGPEESQKTLRKILLGYCCYYFYTGLLYKLLHTYSKAC